MKAGTSSLNPYAASYIPLSRRGVSDKNNGYELSPKDFKNENQSVWLGAHPGDATHSQYQKYSQNYNASAADTFQIPENLKLKGYTSYGSYGSSSQNPKEMTEKQTLDEDYDMDLAYLEMTFPGIADDSLSDVYMANKGDLDATVEMLNQLEQYTVDSTENLPDTLDIGDVSEAGSSSDSASLKLKKVPGGVCGPSGSQTQPLSPN